MLERGWYFPGKIPPPFQLKNGIKELCRESIKVKQHPQAGPETSRTKCEKLFYHFLWARGGGLKYTTTVKLKKSKTDGFNFLQCHGRSRIFSA